MKTNFISILRYNRRTTFFLSFFLSLLIITGCNKEEDSPIIQEFDKEEVASTRSSKVGYFPTENLLIPHSASDSAYLAVVKNEVLSSVSFLNSSIFESSFGYMTWEGSLMFGTNDHTVEYVFVPILEPTTYAVKHFFGIKKENNDTTYKIISKSVLKDNLSIGITYPTIYSDANVFTYFDHNFGFEIMPDYYDDLDDNLAFIDCVSSSETYETLCGCEKKHTVQQMEAGECACTNPHPCGSCPSISILYFLDCDNNGTGADSEGDGPNNDNGNNNDGNNDNGSGGGNWSSGNAFISALYKYLDAENKALIGSLVNTPCGAELEEMYAMIAASDFSVYQVAYANCMIKTMEVSTSGGCSSTFAGNSIPAISEEVLEWTNTFDGNGAMESYENPICDLVMAGYSDEAINSILNSYQIVLENLPDPGYTGDEDPYNIYNVEANVSTINKISQLLLDYPCLNITENLGLLISNPTIVDWASAYLNGGCSNIEGENSFSILNNLLDGYSLNHFSETDFFEILDKMDIISARMNFSNGIPRIEYIDQIYAIKIYLSRRHSEYGIASQYLETLLPYLILQEEFTNEEVYKIYDLAYSWYEHCIFNTLSSVVRNVLIAIRPFIEFALIESGFTLVGQLFNVSANASFRLLSSLPESVKLTSALVWNKIATTAANRINTLVPETFRLTAQTTEQFYVQYSGTKHLAQVVTKNGAVNKPWYQSEMALRSQIVLDDFARAVDDIVINNPNLVMDKIYIAGKWEVKFGAQTSTVNSGGLRRIYHAQPIK